MVEINITEIEENLCYYDKRNPNSIPEDDLAEEDGININEIAGEDNQIKNCYCDNCFYGRTKLANMILKLWDLKV